MKKNKTIQIALADDHVLLRNALARLIGGFEGCGVLHESGDGTELLEKLRAGKVPDVVLLDLNMPQMNGYDTAAALQAEFPQVNTLMLTMYDSELALIRLLQLGVKGFIKKDAPPSELRSAIDSVMGTGYYYSAQTAGKLANVFRLQAQDRPAGQHTVLTTQELRFLELVCSDRTYKEIAMEMKLTPRSVDVLRDALFFKLDVKSRVGLAMLAVKHGLVVG
ncbi:response regulator transcription factor [Flaviaesturariibacter aridisoli]|uniref:Response regulator transcription factor n=1 Tax=Flaviaesturariibacter aridisoli TaxID=2545761 RepID=A0A4V2WMB8_9BACT|nr:response regulator transcription factor [Flaviaesturariibacter aridisoli]TCZ67704.1 response regulator transcription factor [Flaviaesturariibacter aridisoli]